MDGNMIFKCIFRPVDGRAGRARVKASIVEMNIAQVDVNRAPLKDLSTKSTETSIASLDCVLFDYELYWRSDIWKKVKDKKFFGPNLFISNNFF